jgi:hypothetical protein
MPSKYDEQLLTPEQQAGISAAQQDWKTAKANGDSAGMTEAHNRAEAIRNSAGYSGGTDGAGLTSTVNFGNIAQDDRLSNIETDKQNAINDSNAFYNDQINQTTDIYGGLKEDLEQLGEDEKKLIQDQTDFTIEQINQNKDKAAKDYEKEQRAAYADWQKESNRFGVNAETLAANGLAASGYSESSQVAMYNAYQSRVAVARESYNTLVMNYDNAIKDAQIQGSVALAELARDTFNQGMELTLQEFTFKNDLLQAKKNDALMLDEYYTNKYNNTYNQILNEKQLQYGVINDIKDREQQQREWEQSLKDTEWSKAMETAKFNWQKETDARDYQTTLDQLNGKYSRGSNGYYSTDDGLYIKGDEQEQQTPPTEAQTTQTTQTTSTEAQPTQVDKTQLKGTKYEKMSAQDISKAIDNGELMLQVVGDSYVIVPIKIAESKVDLADPFGTKNNPFKTNKSLYK